MAKEIPRMSKQAKLDILDMIKSSDTSTVKLALAMCETYFRIYPAEKKFKKQVRKTLRDSNYGFLHGQFRWKMTTVTYNFPTGDKVTLVKHPQFDEP